MKFDVQVSVLNARKQRGKWSHGLNIHIRNDGDELLR